MFEASFEPGPDSKVLLLITALFSLPNEKIRVQIGKLLVSILRRDFLPRAAGLACGKERGWVEKSAGLEAVSKSSAYNAGDLGSIPGSGRSPGEGNGSPLQYSCLENPMDRGAWRATVHGVARVGHDLATKTTSHQTRGLWGCDVRLRN